MSYWGEDIPGSDFHDTANDQKYNLAREAVQLADPIVNFTEYET